MITSMSTKLASDLRDLLGDEIVADDPNSIAAHSGDKWFATHSPEVVVFARSTTDVSKLLQFASREKVPVTARGGGFGYVGGCVPARGGIALSLMPMNRIKEINFTDAVAIVEPGVCFRFRRRGRPYRRRSPLRRKLPKLYTQFLQLDFYRQHSKSLIISRSRRRGAIWARRLCPRGTRICSSIWMANKRASAARPRQFAN